MHDPLRLPLRQAAAKQRHMPAGQTVERTVISPLLMQGYRGMRWFDPFGSGPMISGQHPQRHMIAVKLPAAIMADNLQPQVHLPPARPLQKQPGKLQKIIPQHVHDRNRPAGRHDKSTQGRRQILHRNQPAPLRQMKRPCLRHASSKTHRQGALPKCKIGPAPAPDTGQNAARAPEGNASAGQRHDSPMRLRAADRPAAGSLLEKAPLIRPLIHESFFLRPRVYDAPDTARRTFLPAGRQHARSISPSALPAAGCADAIGRKPRRTGILPPVRGHFRNGADRNRTDGRPWHNQKAIPPFLR